MKRWLFAGLILVVLTLGYALSVYLQARPLTEATTLIVEEPLIAPEPTNWPDGPVEDQVVEVVLSIPPLSDKRLAFQVGAYVPISIRHWPDPLRVVYDQAHGEVLYVHDTATSSLLKLYVYDDTVSIEENLLRQQGQYEHFPAFDEELFRELCSLKTEMVGTRAVYRLDYDRTTHEAVLNERFPNEGYYVAFFCGYFPYVIVDNLLIANTHARQDATEPRVLVETIRLVP